MVLSRAFSTFGGLGLFLTYLFRTDQIRDQLDVLNYDFRFTGLNFALSTISRIQNATWFYNATAGTVEQTEMKQALRQGGVNALNLYTVDFKTSPGLLGYAAFPDSYESDPIQDGIVLLFESLPGGAATNHNLGRTLTHEVGHWVGLYHTFQGGCSGGDLVSDTAPEDIPAFGCPVIRITCADNGGDREFHPFRALGRRTNFLLPQPSLTSWTTPMTNVRKTLHRVRLYV
jgi:hypothetical protein